MKKEKYLEAIMSVLTKEGLKLSMGAIAEMIGVTKKTLYNRFESKDNLINECFMASSKSYRDALKCMDDMSLPAIDRLKNGIAAVRRHFGEFSTTLIHDLVELYPLKLTVLHTNRHHFLTEKIIQNIEDGIESGEYRPGVDPVLISTYVVTSTFYFYDSKIIERKLFEAKHYFDQITDFIANGLLKK